MYYDKIMTAKKDYGFLKSVVNIFSNHDVINWVIDNQLARRNIIEDQKAYLIYLTPIFVSRLCSTKKSTIFYQNLMTNTVF